MTNPTRPIPVEKLLNVVRESRSFLEVIEKKLAAAADDSTLTAEQMREKTDAAFKLTQQTRDVLDATLAIWRAQEDLVTALSGNAGDSKN